MPTVATEASRIFVFIGVTAFLIERLITHYGKGFSPRVKPFLSAAFGIGFCFVYSVDAYALLGFTAIYPVIGQVLTGLVVGGGSTLTNDILKRFILKATEANDHTRDHRPGASDRTGEPAP